MFYLTTHSTHFISGYMASDIWLRTILKGNPLPPHRLLLSISSKGSFICTIPQTEYIPRPLLHQSWSTGWNDGVNESHIKFILNKSVAVIGDGVFWGGGDWLYVRWVFSVFCYLLILCFVFCLSFFSGFFKNYYLLFVS